MAALFKRICCQSVLSTYPIEGFSIRHQPSNGLMGSFGALSFQFAAVRVCADELAVNEHTGTAAPDLLASFNTAERRSRPFMHMLAKAIMMQKARSSAVS